MVDAENVLQEIAEELKGSFPAADVTIEPHPRFGDVVALRDETLIILCRITPFPKQNPITWRLTIASPDHPSAFWTGATYPFPWAKVLRGIDRVLIHARAADEAKHTIRARVLAWKSDLANLKAKLSKDDHIRLHVTSAGEPRYTVRRVYMTADELTRLWAKLPPRLQQRAKVSTSVVFEGLTAKDVEAYVL